MFNSLNFEDRLVWYLKSINRDVKDKELKENSLKEKFDCDFFGFCVFLIVFFFCNYYVKKCLRGVLFF